VSTFRSGNRNDFSNPCTSITTGPSTTRARRDPRERGEVTV
jgi:hypothetical protein